MALYQTQQQIKDVLINRLNNEGIFVDRKFTKFRGKGIIIYIVMDKEFEEDAPLMRKVFLAPSENKKEVIT